MCRVYQSIGLSGGLASGIAGFVPKANAFVSTRSKLFVPEMRPFVLVECSDAFVRAGKSRKLNHLARTLR
jgi:hypothetical protein